MYVLIVRVSYCVLFEVIDGLSCTHRCQHPKSYPSRNEYGINYGGYPFRKTIKSTNACLNYLENMQLFQYSSFHSGAEKKPFFITHFSHLPEWIPDTAEKRGSGMT